MAKFLFIDDKMINILTQEENASGGAAVQAFGWIRGLEELGHDIYLLTKYHGQPLKEQVQHMKIIKWFDMNKGIKLFRWIYYRLPYFYKTIKKVSPDYVYQGIPNWNSYFLGIICKLLRTKYILRISNDYFLDQRFNVRHSKFHKFFLMRGIKSAYCILCQNDYQYSVISKNFPGKRVFKISNPIVLQKNEIVQYEKRKHIAWLGLFQYQKNLELLYQIASALHQETFVIAGKASTKCDETTLKYLDHLKKRNNVRFVGFLERNEVPEFLSESKFLLNTSRYEGFSNTFLEAMAVGTPIISSDAVNPDEIIPKHQLGIIYKDLPDLLQQYGSLNSDIGRKMSENAYSYVSANHGHLTLSKKLLEIL
jgi:glycosyltransferase involved in cell wall biosynthesis